VVDDQPVAPGVVPVPLGDGAAVGRPDRGATAHAEVGAVVQLVLTGHRVLAHAVRGGDRPVHREHEAVVGGRSAAATTATTAATAATATGAARGLLLLALTRLPLLGGPLLRGTLAGCCGAPPLRLAALLDAPLPPPPTRAATAATATAVARRLLLRARTRLPLPGGPLLRGTLGGCGGAPLLRLDALLDAALHGGLVGLQFGVALLLVGDLVR